MSSFPCLVRLVSGSGQVRYRLADRYVEFVAGRCRPNTLRAVAFDLKVFFTVTGKDPVEVAAADVFELLAQQRGDRTVVRLADRESRLSARSGSAAPTSLSNAFWAIRSVLVELTDAGLRTDPPNRSDGSHVGEVPDEVRLRGRGGAEGPTGGEGNNQYRRVRGVSSADVFAWTPPVTKETPSRIGRSPAAVGDETSGGNGLATEARTA